MASTANSSFFDGAATSPGLTSVDAAATAAAASAAAAQAAASSVQGAVANANAASAAAFAAATSATTAASSASLAASTADQAATSILSTIDNPSTFGGLALVAAGGTAPQSLSDIAAVVFRPEAFGAKGDGVTDDTAAIQKALTAAATLGGKLQFRGVPYRLTSTLSATLTTGASLAMAGEGVGATVLKWDGGTDGIIINCAEAAPADVGFIYLGHLCIDSQAPNTATVGTALAITGTAWTGALGHSVRLEYISFKDGAEDGKGWLNAMHFTQLYRVWASNVTWIFHGFYASSGSFVEISNDATNHFSSGYFFELCATQGPQFGFKLPEFMQGITIDKFACISNYGVYWDIAGPGPENLVLTNSYFAVGACGITLSSNSTCQLDNNVIECANGLNGSALNPDWCALNIDGINYSQITNTIVTGGGTSGLSFTQQAVRVGTLGYVDIDGLIVSHMAGNVFNVSGTLSFCSISNVSADLPSDANNWGLGNLPVSGGGNFVGKVTINSAVTFGFGGAMAFTGQLIRLRQQIGSAISIGVSATGNSQPSFPIQFNSTASDGTARQGFLQMDASGNIVVTTTTSAASLTTSRITLTPTAVAALPAAGTVGRRAFVTDAASAAFGATVTGGGSNKVPVFDNGAAWMVG